MMDWVNNPKNRPFVLLGFLVILGGAFFLIATREKKPEAKRWSLLPPSYGG